MLSKQFYHENHPKTEINLHTKQIIKKIKTLLILNRFYVQNEMSLIKGVFVKYNYVI